MTVQPSCALCEGHPAVKHSHIVTRHMAKWAKSRSATGYFRQERVPSKPEQDLPKIPLLCVGCEKKFEGWEREFHELWDRWCARLEAGDPDVLIGDVHLPEVEWTQRLTLSLCWRALHLGTRGERVMKLSRRSEAAHREWQRALLNYTRPKKSMFLVIQARRMDALLQLQTRIGNRTYIFATTDISSTTSTIKGPVQQTTVYADGRRVTNSFDLKVSFRVGVVKSYGFLFMGAHITTKMPPIPAVEFWRLVAGQFLKGSMRRHRAMWASTSPKQRAAQTDVERKNLASANPALIMRLKAADERERAAWKKRKRTGPRLAT